MRQSLRRLNGRIPRDLDTVCLKCLEREPRKRYATAEALSDDLRRWLKGEPIQVRAISRTARAWRWCKRNPLVAALTAVVIVVLASGAGGSAYLAIAARHAEKETRRLAALNYRMLYASDMNRVGQAIDEGNFGLAVELLRRHAAPTDDDLRGFEWYYLWNCCKRGLATPRLTTELDIRSAALLPRRKGSGCCGLRRREIA